MSVEKSDLAPLREYRIGELAEAAGITRRVVRFYVQRELIDPPQGLGRGSFYTAMHLERIRRIQQLQAEGHSLDAIAQLLELVESSDRVNDSRIEVSEYKQMRYLKEGDSLSDSAPPQPASGSKAPRHIRNRARARLAKEVGSGSGSGGDKDVGLMARLSVAPGVEVNVDMTINQLDKEELQSLKVAIEGVVEEVLSVSTGEKKGEKK